MTFDLEQAASFMTEHARVLDRYRFQAVVTQSEEARHGVIRSLEAYRNTDGGYGWGLEPDLRSATSQPAGAQHAFEAIADAGPVGSPHAIELLEWLQAITLPDGGLPFALPMNDTTACAPFWTQANPEESSLQITAAVAAQAYRAARWDDNIRNHPWLRTATRYCFDAIRETDSAPAAHVLSFSLQLLDAASDTEPEARLLLQHFAQFVPRDGVLAVSGGAEGEALRLLDYAPEPGRPLRGLLDPDAVQRELDDLESRQLQHGGWDVDFDSYSDAARLEWRGYATVAAVSALHRNRG